ncbi:hypothetical protein [Vineibacter terrae]|uniref:hypothetical protein n=1 Tax=Vineibacter terrae TaxID=2586908 RepID=UPI002E2F1622|nr:hypothetical protein [Vineibacter terrae]HEX2888501.1 hypothetical protein [Vineibacter terrae]
MSGPLSTLKPVSRTPANAEIPRYSVWLEQVRGIGKDWPSALTGALLKINEEVKLHDQAFSPMAKRNVAMSIVERINDFKAAWKRAYAIAPLPKPLADLEAAARTQAEMIVSGHKYDYVSCIGYGVTTGKFDAHRFKATWTGTKYEYNGLVEYAGASTDAADSLARCAALRQAIDDAHTQYQAAHGADKNDAKTLKIFMAPEFFFRGLNGAYDISRVSDIFTNLRTHTSDAKFKDWLFVFGTVIGASFDDRLFCKSCGKTGAKSFVRTGPKTFECTGCPPGSVAEGRLGARIDNVALIQKGGESDFKNSYVIEKEYVSHIDFRRYASPQMLKDGKKKTGYDGVAILKDWDDDRRIELMGRAVKVLPVPGSRDVGGGTSSKFSDERMGGSIFTIDGIKFGLEICLDHLNAKIPAGTGIQIQLVPSAGAYLNKLTCITNGIGFNVDGLSAKCDLQVNSSGTPTKLTATSGAGPGGGTIEIFAPQAIPYS